MRERCAVCGESADPRWYVARPACDGHGEAFPEEILSLRARIAELEAERDRYLAAIVEAVAAAGNRWSEWGDRAVSVAEILDAALYPALRRIAEEKP